MGSTERLQRQVMLPLQVWSQAGNHIWSSCVTWLRRVFVGCVGYCWHGRHFVSSSLEMSGCARTTVRSMWWWRPGACVTAILIPSLVLPLEYAVLDDMAKIWFFHYARCYSLCDLAINDMVCNPALSIGVARDARRRDGLCTNAYL